jgi:hypothetical protein
LEKKSPIFVRSSLTKCHDFARDNPEKSVDVSARAASQPTHQAGQGRIEPRSAGLKAAKPARQSQSEGYASFHLHVQPSLSRINFPNG